MKGEKKMGGKWALKEMPFFKSKNGRAKKKKRALDGRQPKQLKIVLHFLKNCKKRTKKCKKRSKPPLKKMGTPKKKGGKMGAKKTLSKKKKGNAHFFGIDF